MRKPKKQQKKLNRPPAARASSTFSPLAIQRRGEVADLLGIDRGLRLEVEALQLLHRREVGEFQFQCHLDAPVVCAWRDRPDWQIADPAVVFCRQLFQLPKRSLVKRSVRSLTRSDAALPT